MRPHSALALFAALVCLGSWLALCPRLSAEVTAERSDQGVVIQAGGQPFAEYLTHSGHQPVVWPIIGPTGKRMTRSYPLGSLLPSESNDHPHHRSLWFTHGDVNGLDFWLEPENSAEHKDNQIVHREFREVKSGRPARILAVDDWMTGGKKVCEDERTLLFGADDKVRWIDFTITIKATDGDVTLGDTKEGAFGVRVAGTMKVDAGLGGRVFNSNGLADEAAWGMPAKWVDYYGPVDGETVGLAIFSHPSNFRPECRWHARNYGLVAANPFGQREFRQEGPQQGAVTIPAGDELTLRYRVLLHAGDTDQADIADRFRDWAASSGQPE